MIGVWIVFAALAVVFLLIFLKMLIAPDRPPEANLSRGYDPFRKFKDAATDQAIVHAKKEQEWIVANAGYIQTEERLANAVSIERLEHTRKQVQEQLLIHRTNEAIRRGLDLNLLEQFQRLEKVLEIELLKMRAESEEKLEQHRQMKEIDVQAYGAEVAIDLKAALAQRTIGHMTVRQIEQEFQKLVQERAVLEADESLTPFAKEIALEAKDALILAFRKNLNDQMARHLLSEGNGEDIQGMGTQNQSG